MSKLKEPYNFLINGNPVAVSVFHIIIGLTCLYTPILLIIWFGLIFLSTFTYSGKSQTIVVTYAVAYLLPIELIGRISKAHPFIPTEAGKYLGILLLFFGILSSKKLNRGAAGKWMLLLSLPSLLLVPLTFYNIRYSLVFNYFGFLALTLSVIFFSNQWFTVQDIKKIFRTIILGSLSTLAYVIIKSPKIEASQFELAANSSFTGNYGSNQVSSLLGLSFGLAVFLYIFRMNIFKISILNTFIVAAPLVWALLSFSRGGIITSVLAIALTLIFSPKEKGRDRRIRINWKSILVPIAVLGILFVSINNITDNKLLLRYKGESEGTIQGYKKKDTNHLLSGRVEISASDLKIWSDNPIFGVGPGQSPTERLKYGFNAPVAPHIEITRLVADHGLFGLIIAVIFLLKPTQLFLQKQRHPFSKSLMLFCFTVAIFSSFHSSMRTFITPFFYGLAFVNIYSNPGSSRELTKSRSNKLVLN